MNFVSLSKSDLLMNNLYEFYKIEKNINALLPIINGDSKISLRVIDWFVTNYSKKFNISYILSKNNKDEIIDKKQNFFVYLNYKSQLKSYSKKQFDPFCRKNKIEFYYKDNKYIETDNNKNINDNYIWDVEPCNKDRLKYDDKMMTDIYNYNGNEIYLF